MNAQASRKFIVVGVMAVVVGIGVVTFAMHSHTVTPAAEAVTPPVPLADSVPAEDVGAPIPEVAATPAPVAPVVAVPTTPAHKDVVVVRRASARNSDSTVSPVVEPKIAAKPAAAAPDLSMTAAAAAVANASEPVQGATATTTTPAPDTLALPAPAVATVQYPETSAPLAASDSEITTNVKSEIAIDSLGKNASIGVVTTNGVVALTGSVASQDDIDHIKVIVARVKDVKSVDTSALSLPTT